MLDLRTDHDFPTMILDSYNRKVVIPDFGLPEPPKSHQPAPGKCLCPKPYRMMQNVRKISASHHNNLCVDADDVLWSWGVNYLGEKLPPSYSYPQTVDYCPKKCMENVLTADAGARHTLAVTKDGTLWSWGKNDVGQLGRGDRTDSAEPTPVMDRVKRVFANDRQSFAIKEDGSLWGWGYNGNGVLLDAPEYCAVPHLLMQDVESVSANPETVLVLKTDHTLWGWGTIHACGIFFQSERAKRYSPTLILGGAAGVSIAKIEEQSAFCYVIAENGDLFVLGDRGGPGNPVWQFRVQQVNGLYKVMEGVADAKIGSATSLVRMRDGRVFSTGCNDLGECGDGKSSGYRTKFVPLMTDAVDIAIGYSHGMALRENGDLWIWGGSYGFDPEAQKKSAKRSREGAEKPLSSD